MTDPLFRFLEDFAVFCDAQFTLERLCDDIYHDRIRDPDGRDDAMDELSALAVSVSELSEAAVESSRRVVAGMGGLQDRDDDTLNLVTRLALVAQEDGNKASRISAKALMVTRRIDRRDNPFRRRPESEAADIPAQESEVAESPGDTDPEYVEIEETAQPDGSWAVCEPPPSGPSRITGPCICGVPDDDGGSR